MPDPDYPRLAEAVRERRLAQDGMTQSEAASEAGVSDTTWNQVETGKPVSPRSRVKMARALGWDAGSFDRILQGGDPIELEPPRAGADEDLVQAVRDLTEMVRLLRQDLGRGR